MLVNLQILISGLICGVILFQTAIIAPSIFKVLSPDNAGPFLRTIFPKLFMFVAVLSLAGFVLSLISSNTSGLIVFFGSLLFMLICYYIVPMTNRARDAGNDNAFKRLHTVSVVLTMIVLLSNLLWIFFK
tara:strand:+ start:208 stop:597 length:390 start_codon:yes stop_codon:yes gene_type:complete